MRGQQSLFKELLKDEEATMTVLRQGRSEYLHDRRNECLIDRYYYKLKFSDMRFDSILKELRDEFFIETFTVQERISEGYEYLTKLKKEEPAKNTFAKKWPHLVW